MVLIVVLVVAEVVVVAAVVSVAEVVAVAVLLAVVSAVVVAALIPWSIAGGAPLSSAGAPLSSIFFAFFLYLLPLWRLSLALFRKH